VIFQVTVAGNTMTFITDFKAFSTVMRMKDKLTFDEIGKAVVRDGFNGGTRRVCLSFV
jgi:hypothetical protein